jgi:hypothetical protein
MLQAEGLRRRQDCVSAYVRLLIEFVCWLFFGLNELI